MEDKKIQKLYEKNKELMKQIREFRDEVEKQVRLETSEILWLIRQDNKKIKKSLVKRKRSIEEYRLTKRLETPNLKISDFILIEYLIENSSPKEISEKVGWSYSKASSRKAQLKCWLSRLNHFGNNREKILKVQKI